MITDRAVDIIEKLGIITSEPFFNSKDFIATSSAAVPFETDIPYFFECKLEKDFSNFFINLPLVSWFVLRHSITFLFHEYLIKVY